MGGVYQLQFDRDTPCQFVRIALPAGHRPVPGDQRQPAPLHDPIPELDRCDTPSGARRSRRAVPADLLRREAPSRPQLPCPRPCNVPTCRRPVEWSPASPYRPFCSDRCRLIDLGAWLSEKHAIPSDTPASLDADSEAGESTESGRVQRAHRSRDEVSPTDTGLPARYLAPALLAVAAVGAPQAAELTIDRLFDAPALGGPTIAGLKISPDGARITYLQGSPDDKDRLDLWEYRLADGAGACWSTRGCSRPCPAALGRGAAGAANGSGRRPCRESSNTPSPLRAMRCCFRSTAACSSTT